MTHLADRYRWFRRNGWIVTPGAARNALDCARAEERLERDVDAGRLRFRWECEPEPDLSWHPKPESVTVVVVLVLERRCPTCGQWEHVGSLGNIVDPDDNFERVERASMALEHYEGAGR